MELPVTSLSSPQYRPTTLTPEQSLPSAQQTAALREAHALGRVFPTRGPRVSSLQGVELRRLGLRSLSRLVHIVVSAAQVSLTVVSPRSSLPSSRRSFTNLVAWAGSALLLAVSISQPSAALS